MSLLIYKHPRQFMSSQIYKYPHNL